MVRELNIKQLEEIATLLGTSIDNIGEWSLTPDTGPVNYAIRCTGDIVVRLSSKDRAGRLQRPRISRFMEDSGHYLFCSFNNKTLRLHRVVASIWLDDYSEDLTVNHKDGNKHNNDYRNLEMLSVHDNCMYYHHSEAVSEQRRRDYAYHGTTISGRIHITDGIQGRMIYENEGIPEGWYKGRPQSMKTNTSMSLKGVRPHNKGKTMITDGKTNRYVGLSDDVPDGWRRGASTIISPDARAARGDSMKGRSYINDGQVNRRVHQDELDAYLSCGWSLGMLRKRNSKRD